jgi:hypothetical protein
LQGKNLKESLSTILEPLNTVSLLWLEENQKTTETVSSNTLVRLLKRRLKNVAIVMFSSGRGLTAKVTLSGIRKGSISVACSDGDCRGVQCV